MNPRSSRRELVSILLRWLFLLWALLIFVYFLRKNSGLWSVFGALFGRYTFSLENTPPLEFLQALFALAITQLFGWLVLRALRVRMRWWEEQALALPVGFGLSGIFLELLTMAHGLHVAPLWLLWMAMIGGAGVLAWRGCGRPPLPLLFGSEQTESEALPIPQTPLPKVRRAFVIAGLTLAGLITLATFWHALFYPETYWDSLILYLGYARMTFLQHAFPFKAEAQVGIGLGANYPHLFSTYGAMASTLFNHWSDLPQRLICPLAGAACTALVYASCLRAWRRHDVATAAALLFRSVPYGIAYATWASDYAFAILFTAAFLFAFLMFVRRPGLGELAVMTIIPAVGMHLNYLMGILWVPWLVGVLLTAWLRSPRQGVLRALTVPLRHRWFWAIYLAGVALALPWYIRNWTLTGNPVYSFFPEIFTSGVRVNPEALRSAELEWFRNGDGIGKLAEAFWDLEHQENRDIFDSTFERRAGVWERLSASYLFWVGYDVVLAREDGTLYFGPASFRLSHLLNIFRNDTPPDGKFSEQIGENVFLLHWVHAYKMMILFPAFFFPSLILVLVAVYRLLRGRLQEEHRVPAALFLLSAFTALLLLSYMYLLADFYLYQIIGVLAPAALCAGCLLNAMLTGKGTRWLAPVLYLLVLAQAFSPGLAFALMNFKFSTQREIDGQVFSQGQLDAFRNPGLPPELFYRMQYGDDVLMWEHVNQHIPNARILSHENRHYVFDPGITFVHLDDWDIQKGYGIEDPQALVEFLHGQNLHWYLETPMEKKHAINLRLGMDMLKEAGLLREEFRAGDNVLYRIGKE